MEGKLIELLRSLTPPEWEMQTVSPRWNVKNVAAHLLDTQIRKLAAARRGYKPKTRKSGSWYLFRGNHAWALIASPLGEKISETTIPQEIAWRIFTKGISRAEAEAQVHVKGNAELGLHILKMISIVG